MAKKGKTNIGTPIPAIKTPIESETGDWTGAYACTPFGRVPVIEDLGDRVTVEYADKSRKVFEKSEITISK